MESIIISLALGAFMLKDTTCIILVYAATSGLWSVSLLLRRKCTISDSSSSWWSVVKTN